MNFSIVKGALLTFLILTVLQNEYLYSQTVTPKNIFDTGINLGYLEAHSISGTSPGTYAVWASNAEDEWLSSWESGMVPSIVVNPPYPFGVYIAKNQCIESIMIKGSSDCLSPWFKSAIDIFRAGHRLGVAYVEAGSNCSGCLRITLLKAAINLQNVGQKLRLSGIPIGISVETWAANLKTAADGMELDLDANKSAIQNSNMASGILEIINAMNVNLPGIAMPCKSILEPKGILTGAISSYGRLTTSDFVQKGSKLQGDGKNDWAFNIKLNGNCTVTKISVRNINGVYSIWDTDPKTHYWLSAISDGHRILNNSDGSVNITVNGDLDLIIYVSDNGSIAGAKTDYKINVWYDSGKSIELR
jgi:hypothetical protein